MKIRNRKIPRYYLIGFHNTREMINLYSRKHKQKPITAFGLKAVS